MAILFISSELEEVVRVSGRVAVLRDRVKVGELEGDAINEQTIMRTIAEGGPSTLIAAPRSAQGGSAMTEVQAIGGTPSARPAVRRGGSAVGPGCSGRRSR